MATYGYGRVSRKSQHTENQKLAIEADIGFPLDDWFEDHAKSGTIKTTNRPLFSKMINTVTEGDTIVFSRVDRIARRASDSLTAVEDLLRRGVEVYVLEVGKEKLSTPNGWMLFTMFAMIAERTRLDIVSRVNDGLARVRHEGRILGPKLKIVPEVLESLCVGRANNKTLDELSNMYGIDRNTIDRNVKKWQGNLSAYRVEWNNRQQQYEKKVV